MNAKEKAIEIMSLYKPIINNSMSRECAIIHVKGIIEELESMRFRTNIGGIISYEGGQLIDKIQYWQQVLTELKQIRK